MTQSDPQSVNLEAVQQARERIQHAIVRTPTARSLVLSAKTQTAIWLKFENHQFTAAFKERGALNKLLSVSAEQRRRGVIAASAGNHAQAVAYHARQLGLRATIVMPKSTPFIKISQTELLGAKVEQYGETVDASTQRALSLAAEQGWVWIHPFDDPLVIAGQGTIALELLEDAPQIDTVVVPIGGGGLISGVGAVCKALAPSVRVVGVQCEQFCSMAKLFHENRQLAPAARSTEADRPVARSGPFGADTLADGIAVKTPGQLTRKLVCQLVDDILVVSEPSLERACNELLETEKTVAEGAGAASLAAILEHPDYFAGRNVACLLTGGNMDPRVMADTILRGLVRTGRLARLRIDVRDLPGSLADITRVIAEAGANIVDVRHERVFMAMPTLRTRLGLEIATRNQEHVRLVAQALKAAGHKVKVL